MVWMSKLNPNAAPFNIGAARSPCPTNSLPQIPYLNLPFHPHYLSGQYHICIQPPCFWEAPIISQKTPAITSFRSQGYCPTRRRRARRHSPQVSVKRVPEERGRVCMPFPSNLTELEMGCLTTVMLKNIPNHFRRRDIIRVINRHCRMENSLESSSSGICKSEYDFLYLPMDFNKYWLEKKISNLGYAFVNFTSPIAAWRFHQRHNNYDWNSPVNNKICEVALAKIQGRKSLVENFITKRFFCHSDEYLPLVLSPACNGMASNRLSRNIGVRIPTKPRHPIVKDLAQA